VVRLAAAAATSLVVGLALSCIARAEPLATQAPGSSTPVAPGVDHDPAPPAAVCSDLDDSPGWAACTSMCDGISASYTMVTPISKACDEAGRAQREGRRPRGFPPSAPNAAEAFRYFGLACTPAKALPGIAPAAPYWGGCFDLGGLYLQGFGAPKDETAARRLYQRACSMAAPGVTYEACFALGELLEAGTGGPKDLTGALDAYKKACSASYPRACRAAQRLQPARTPSPAR
jgi:hypothetical protein